MPDGALEYTADEMMTISAARMLRNGASCFVGIGLPSAAANLARLTHAPDAVLIYESGCIGTKPNVLPLSIGDGELSETADTVVSIIEIFTYWLQGGRIDIGFLGAAQIDRFANINSTVIGDYDSPKTRLPGAGGAPAIAANCGEVLVTLRQNKRAFVEKLDFQTSGGHMEGGDSRERMRFPGKGPTAVITDLGIMTPDPVTKELTLTSVHQGVTVDSVVAATGWKLKVADQVSMTPRPTELELTTLRDLQARTAKAHAGQN
ncbi:MAG TPA: CoA-transferase [Bryobacteraceae bacterium]|jgi:glutaconate CoA-transferase subunit B|nr:CoA-transferase [Bryobacteraceae bacterium]